MNKQFLAALLVVLLAPLAARGHSPDPTFSGPLWAQNQVVKYSWKSGLVPPSWMKPAINAASTDNNETRRSRAAVFQYQSGASSKISYGEPSGCGVNGIACMARTAPTSFKVKYRKHGKVFDWGTLKWCQKYDGTAPNGCYDVRNIHLDELGHVQILQHHVNYASNSDYGQAIVQTYSRTKGHTGWNTHAYKKCDVATLQKKYDVQHWYSKISTCLDLDTNLSLSKSIAQGNVTFTASLKIKDLDSYGKLGGNPLTKRRVVLQMKSSGSDTWTNLGDMADAPDNKYTKTIADPSGTKNFRAKFVAADDEGLNSRTSPWVTF
jgi:hypothetical protein